MTMAILEIGPCIYLWRLMIYLWTQARRTVAQLLMNPLKSPVSSRRQQSIDGIPLVSRFTRLPPLRNCSMHNRLPA